MLELYHHNISVCAQKVRIALVEKGLDWTPHHIHLMRGEQVSPDYLAMNPKGVVPTLVHDGEPILESTIILEYLEDAFQNTPLRPESPLGRARMRLWTKVPDDGLHAACGTVTYAAVFAEQMVAYHGLEKLADRLEKLPDRARAARQRELLDKRLDASLLPPALKLHDKMLADMEKTLAGQPWLAGADYSIAECAILPYIYRLERLGLENMWAERPKMADWYARAKARPSWDVSMEAYQSLGGDDYDDDLKSRGKGIWPKVSELLAA